jgi:hypothetical protein
MRGKFPAKNREPGQIFAVILIPRATSPRQCTINLKNVQVQLLQWPTRLGDIITHMLAREANAHVDNLYQVKVHLEGNSNRVFNGHLDTLETVLFLWPQGFA